MKKIFMILSVSAFLPAVSFGALISAEYQGMASSLTVVSAFKGKTAADKISLENCSVEKRAYFPGNARNFIDLQYFPMEIIWSEGKKIKTGGEAGDTETQLELSKAITVLSSAEGFYITASDGLTVYLLRKDKKNIASVLKKETNGGITALLADENGKILYAADRNGNIFIWSFAGKLLASVKTNESVYGLMADKINNGAIAVTGTGLYAIVPDRGVNIRKIYEDKAIIDAYLDNDNKRIVITNGAGAAVLDYPSMKIVSLLPGIKGKIMKGGGRYLTGFYGRDSLRIFDLRTSLETAEIYVTETGIDFYPPKNISSAYGTLTADFISAAAGNAPRRDTAEGKRAACQNLMSLTSGVFLPSGPLPERTIMAEIPAVKNPPAPFLKEPGVINRPEDPLAPHEKNIGGVKDPLFKSGVSQPGFPEIPGFTPSVKEPAPPKAEPPPISASGGTPAWIATRKNLPYYKSVGSGEDVEKAAEEGKKRLKNGTVRAIVQNNLQRPELKTIKETDVKKRLLWQSASKTAAAAADKTGKILEEWTSPAGMKYVLIQADEKFIDAEAEKIFKSEINLLDSLGSEAYMKIKPVSLE